MVSETPSAIARLLQDFRQNPARAVHHWQGYRRTWLIMLATAIFLELCALVFQYILELEPCELCVYQRLAVVILMLASVLMLLSPTNILLRLTGYVTWITGALYGLDKALIQTADYADFDPLNSTCNFRPVFPFDLPLYEWLPSVFMPNGICGEDSWSFLGMNMAQWMVVIFSIYLLAAAVCVLSSVYCRLSRMNQ